MKSFNDFLRKNEFYLVSLVLFFNFLLRLINITGQDYWRDEAFSVNAAKKGFFEVFSIAANDTQPPLHLLITNVFGEIFGYSELVTRGISLFYIMLALIFSYLISKLIFRDVIYRIIFLILLGISPLLITYAQEARPYAMLTFVFVGSYYYFLKISSELLEKKSEIKSIDFVNFSLLNLFGLYTQNIFVVVSFAFGLSFIYKLYQKNGFAVYKSENFKKLFLTFFSIGVFYLPWLFIFLKQYSKISGEGFWLEFNPIPDFFNNFGAFIAGHVVDNNFEIYDYILLVTIITIGSILFILGMFKELANRKKFATFSMYFLISLIIFLISFKTPFYYIRYLMFLTPLFFLIITQGFYEINLRTKLKISSWLVMILFITTMFLHILDNKIYYDSKPKYTQAVEYVESKYNQNDLFLVPNALAFHSTYFYSDEVPVYIYNSKEKLAFYEGIATLEDKDFFKGNLSEYNQVFVLRLYKDEGLEDRLRETGYRLQDDKWFDGVSVEVWRRN